MKPRLTKSDFRTLRYALDILSSDNPDNDRDDSSDRRARRVQIEIKRVELKLFMIEREQAKKRAK